MKNAKRAVALATAAVVSILMLTSASEWEGAGAIAGPGELPDAGLYVATNAFPRNTVVDVMNLENEKTVRVIVAGPLNAPGLLVSLSREAASVLKLSSREVGRFRVSMPVDPVAYSRFAEGLASNTDPDYNPMSAIERAGAQSVTEEALSQAAEPASPAPVEREPAPATVETPRAPATVSDSPVTRLPSRPVVQEPLVPEVIEVRPASQGDDILALTGSEPLPREEDVTQAPVETPPPLVSLPPVAALVPARPELVELPLSPREGQTLSPAGREALPSVPQEKAPEQDIVIVRVIEAPAEANPPATESDALVTFDVPLESGPEYSEVPGMARPANGIHPDEEPLALALASEEESQEVSQTLAVPPVREDVASVEDSQPLAEQGAAISLEEEPRAPAQAVPELVEVPGSEREGPLPEALEPGYTEPPVEEIAAVIPGDEAGLELDVIETGPEVALVVEGERPANGIHPDEEPGTPDLRLAALEKAALTLEQAESRPPASGPAPELPADGEIASIIPVEVLEEAQDVPRIAEGAPFVENLPPEEPESIEEVQPLLNKDRIIASIPEVKALETTLPASPSLPMDRELAALVEEPAAGVESLTPPSLVGKKEIAALAESAPVQTVPSKKPPLEAELPVEKTIAEHREEPVSLPAEPVPPSLSTGALEDLGLSVPVVSSLVRGRYYLQICAVAHLDNLVQELSLHSRYPLVVHPDTSGGKTVYRLLVGPVNQGESGALLSHFKRSGYRDAFIKKG